MELATVTAALLGPRRLAIRAYWADEQVPFERAAARAASIIARLNDVDPCLVPAERRLLADS